MKSRSNIGIVLAVSFMAPALGESMAFPCEPPPTDCSSGSNLTVFNTGLAQGESLVEQIWKSTAVGQDIHNWDILAKQVKKTIPSVVNVYYRNPDIDIYTKCRIQGLLEGTVWEMNQLDPFPGCQLDKGFWWDLSAFLYCKFVGCQPGDQPPFVLWFMRTPPGMCC